MLVPKSFLPPGDSGVIFGAFIAQEGSSPKQMREYQERVDQMLQQDPNVINDFTLTGATGFLPSNTGITFTYIGPPDKRKPIEGVSAELMGKLNTIPGIMTFLRPWPVLQISTGVTNQTQGQYAFTVSGTDPNQVYEVGQKLLAISERFIRPLHQHTEPEYRYSPRSGQDLWCLRSTNFDAAA
jgi:HAE1 family hydrophobic/amphiphilic exporter-1